VIEVQLVNDSDLVQHLTGLAVSLVPGSLIINADPERRTLLIHLLDVEHDPKEQMTRNVLAQEERIQAALAYSPRSVPTPSAPDGDRDGRPAE
jgi:multicomponent Na+:H+ antiporter subunit E